MTTSSLGDILIGAAADVVSHDYLRHNLALEAENLEGGGGGGDSKGEDVSVGERLFENGGGGGPIAASNELYPRYLMRVEV